MPLYGKRSTRLGLKTLSFPMLRKGAKRKSQCSGKGVQRACPLAPSLGTAQVPSRRNAPGRARAGWKCVMLRYGFPCHLSPIWGEVGKLGGAFRLHPSFSVLAEHGRQIPKPLIEALDRPGFPKVVSILRRMLFVSGYQRPTREKYAICEKKRKIRSKGIGSFADL